MLKQEKMEITRKEYEELVVARTENRIIRDFIDAKTRGQIFPDNELRVIVGLFPIKKEDKVDG